MSRKPEDLIANAREHLRILREHLERGDLDDDTIFDAVCMRLSAAIEAIASIDTRTRDKVFGATWSAIWGIRNRIAHGYIYIDRMIINGTVENDLPEFETGIDQLAELIAGNTPAAGD